jgi:hypothetical protein
MTRAEVGGGTKAGAIHLATYYDNNYQQVVKTELAQHIQAGVKSEVERL